VATPVGVDMLGVIKHTVKDLPYGFLSVPTVDTLGVSITLLKMLSCCFLTTQGEVL
jgi:hypothetical protein